jgi:hypothetical protein
MTTTSAPEPRTSSRSALLPVGALLLAAGACYLVGGVGYGMAAEYGMGLTEGGLWQLVLIGSLVVGPVWAALVLLLARITEQRLTAPGLVATGVALCFAAGGVGSVLGDAVHEDRQQATRQACRDGVADEMRELADAARPDASPYVAAPHGTPTGCMVDIAVTVGVTDTFGYVSGEVEELGYAPDGDDGWVRGDLRVRMRVQPPESEEGKDKEYFVAFYGERR